MVCLGNICRSPLAEGILQKKADEAGLDWVVESAGTNSFHTGQPPHHLSQKIARKNGLDISGQIARRFSADDFSKYDRIYAMANDVADEMRIIAGNKFDKTKFDLFLNELYPGKNKDVPDPWYGDEEGYIDVFDIIDRACDAVILNHRTEKQKA